ncbi:MAG: ThuA domain-containing protein [Deltaproteobacteria bacterium]|nr:MAG: ThuA domain-containing protein [Deltaproteobacteria bacterium]TMB29754.1 MAG: ThuA domain-containing protein [Deltaproteobacteria bacterium]
MQCLWCVCAALTAALGAAGCASGTVTADAGASQADLVVYTRTLGFRHESIPAALAAVRDLASREGLSVLATEDPSAFTPDRLRGVKAVVFLHTTGEVLDKAGQDALQAYIRGGRGFLGVHSAADTGHNWPWYLQLLGAEFVSHPAIQAAALVRQDTAHPATTSLPDRWTRTDEWYNFRASPRGRVHVLLSIDETSYQGGAMGADHPMAWCHEFEGGRSAYTELGHTTESWSEPLFLAHVRGALRWAAGIQPGDCSH